VTSPMEMTVEELKRKLQAMSQLGWIRSSRSGDTGVGHTLEGLLGYGEKNLFLPDWGEVEVKTTRADSSTPITLLSKSPTLVERLDRRSLVRRHGYWDPARQRQALYVTIDAVAPNSQGWIMKINEELDRIEFLHRGELVAYQDVTELSRKLEEKVSNLVLIIAERKREEKTEFFRYAEAYLLGNAAIDRLLTLLQTGVITFDWRMHLKDTGAVRDHGAVYRIAERNLHKLYTRREKLL